MGRPHTEAVRAGDYRYFDTPFMALAHRGGAAYPPNVGRENTVHAFRQAVSLGYRHLETDVQATRDGHVVVFHDDTLDRVTDGHGLVSALALDELASLRVGGLDPIPTLGELLTEFPGAFFNIDLKTDAAIGPLARTLIEYGAQDRVCVGSFSSERLARFRALVGHSVATSAGPRGVAWYAFGLVVRRFRWPAGVAVQIPRRIWKERVPLLSPGLIRAAHRGGRVVHVWTVDEPGDMHHLIDLGVDGIVTDRIDVLKDVLIERHLWDGHR